MLCRKDNTVLFMRLKEVEKKVDIFFSRKRNSIEFLQKQLKNHQWCALSKMVILMNNIESHF